MKNYTFTTGFARLIIEAESWEKANQIAQELFPMLKIKDHEQ